MLVESHQPQGAEDEPAPAKADAPAENAEDAMGAFAAGNGVTAFAWSELLEYEEAAGRAVMDGSVVVSHQPDPRDDKKEPPVRLDADSLTALFVVQRPEPRDARSANSTADLDKPAEEKAGDGDAPRLQLRSISAQGRILITREGAELRADRLDYDPQSEWIIARGTDRNPATFSDPSGAGNARADELWLNSKTWAVKVKNLNTRVGGLSR
jgi:hypothetical protein